MRLLAAIVFVCGCGFTGVPSGSDLSAASDGGGPLPTPDFAGVDLYGVDLTMPGGPPDLAMGGNNFGPGPLGALPAGFCCSSNDQCRSRRCVNGGSGSSYCDDDCDHDSICSVYGASLKCSGSGVNPCGFGSSGACCVPVNASFVCLDAALYQYGSKAIGSCCQIGFDKSGQECLGGLCESTGNVQSNPFICTQGCTGGSCPSGYTCMANFCWITGTVTDPDNYTYTCN